MSVQAIIFDIDGTLLDSNKRINPLDREKICAAQAKGVKIVFATGRNEVYTRDVAAQLGGVEAVIGSNGASISRLSDNRVLYSRYLAKEAVQTLAAYALAHSFDIMASVFGKMYHTSDSKRVAYYNKYNAAVRPEYRVPLQVLHDAAELADEEVMKLFIWRMPVAFQAEFKQLCSQFAIELVFSEAEGLDISPSGVSKGEGVRNFASLYNIPLTDIAAFGNHDNDISMLKIVGWPVAMGNAVPALKQVAKFVTAGNDEAGIAAALENYLKL